MNYISFVCADSLHQVEVLVPVQDIHVRLFNAWHFVDTQGANYVSLPLEGVRVVDYNQEQLYTAKIKEGVVLNGRHFFNAELLVYPNDVCTLRIDLAGERIGELTEFTFSTSEFHQVCAPAHWRNTLDYTPIPDVLQ
jgi:hypothetical protein